MKLFIEKLQILEPFSRAEAYACFEWLFQADINNQQIAEFLSLLHKRELQASELAGFHDYLSENYISCELDSDCIFDVCGTGGDGKNTINISTLTAFVLAAMGEKVAKHGNYSATSTFGSSNLLEALDVPLVHTPEKANQIFDATGIVFLHAPLWHPKLKQVAKVRKELGFRTVFNLLGPILNPASPRYQLIGTPSLPNAKLLADVLSIKLKDSSRHFAVLHDYNGYDEVSLTSTVKAFYKSVQTEFSHLDYGVDAIKPESISLPETMEQTVVVSKRLLAGLGDPSHEAVVAANTAIVLQLKYPEKSLSSLYSEAISAIKSGKAMQILHSLRSFK